MNFVYEIYIQTLVILHCTEDVANPKGIPRVVNQTVLYQKRLIYPMESDFNEILICISNLSN